MHHVEILRCETYFKCSSLPLGAGSLLSAEHWPSYCGGTDKPLYEKSFSSSGPKDLGPKFGSGLPDCCKHVPIGKKNVIFLSLYSTNHEQTRPQGMVLQPTDPNTRSCASVLATHFQSRGASISNSNRKLSRFCDFWQTKKGWPGTSQRLEVAQHNPCSNRKFWLAHNNQNLCTWDFSIYASGPQTSQC